MRHLISYPTIRGWLSHLQSDMIAGRCKNSRRTLMPFKNENSSGWWVSIHRNANCYESPERNLQWRRHTWYMDTHLLKLTLRNTLVYPSINTHLGLHTSMPQPRMPMEHKPSSSATYARRQLQWRRAHTNLIRPILKYSGVVRDPYTAQDVNKLEMVQHRYGTPATHPGTMVEPAASLPSWKLSAGNAARRPASPWCTE